MGDDLKQQSNNIVLQEEEGEINDRISSLNDSLLHHILSYLPTREVIRTGVLSQRWKSLWTGVPMLDFEDSYDDTEFLNIIERVLLLRDGTSIQKFRLLLSECFTNRHPRVQLLIAAAVSHNVQQLDIVVIRICSKKPFTLPCSVYDCPSLTALKLSMACTLELPSRISLPCLKVLHLRFFEFPDAKSIENLFSCCPVLEELTLVQCRLIHLKGINITIPSLKSLVMDYSFKNSYCVADRNSHCYIKVEAPALQFFNYKGKLTGIHLNLSKTSSIEKFQLWLPDCVSSDYPCVQKLITAAVTCELQELEVALSDKYEFALPPCSVFDCQSLRILKLSMKSTLELPGLIFLPRLKVLHLSCFAFPDAESIENLLSSCHVLEELALSKCRWFQRNSVNIDIPSLKSLTMDHSLEYYDIVDDPTNDSCCYANIEAPDLRFFNYKGKLSSSHLNLSKASSLEKFQLSLCRVVSSKYTRVQSLIAASVSPKIQHVDIDITIDYPDDPMTLPCSVFDSQSLCILKLSMNCTLVLPDNISLPSLKVMYLHSIAFQDTKSIEKLFSCCPVLEELTLRTCRWIQTSNITISFPSLKKLTLCSCVCDPSNCSITIDAPALMYFNYTTSLANHLYLTNTSSSSSSIEACIETTWHYNSKKEGGLRLVELLRCLENMVSLTICGKTGELLSVALADKDPKQLAVFRRLKHLDLNMYVKGLLLKRMLKLFYFMPNLCSIAFSEGVDYTIHKAGIKWMPKPLPECFVSSLKTLSLGEVVVHSHEFVFLTSILEKVVSLERINIFQNKHISQGKKATLREEVKMLSIEFPHCVIIVQ